MGLSSLLFYENVNETKMEITIASHENEIEWILPVEILFI